MRTPAAVLYEMGRPRPYGRSRPLSVEEVELLEPGPGEALVEVQAAGLCHSDLSVIDGTRPRVMPMVLGHEATGVVRAVGPGVTEVPVGDRVVFSFVPTCGRCRFCAVGRPALCERGNAANAAGCLLDGSCHFRSGDRTVHHHMGVSAFSRFTVVAQESLVRVDADVAPEVAALFGCAVLTGVGAVFNTARVEPGTAVAVFGLGGVGLSALLGCRAAGAHPVVAVDVREEKLQLARDLGATHVVHAGEEDAVARVRDLTGGGAAYAFECVGSERVLEQAYLATARGGVTVTVGLPDPSRMVQLSAVTLVTEERTLRGSYMGSSVPRRDIPRYVAMYRGGLLPVDRLLSRVVQLEDINEAFDELAEGRVVRQVVRF